jgi:hypothetical protein
MPSGSTSPRAESATARLFVALWPDAGVRAGLAAYRDAWRWPQAARPVADENLHATLHFIGGFVREHVTALVSSLAAVRAEAPTLQPEAKRKQQRHHDKAGVAQIPSVNVPGQRRHDLELAARRNMNGGCVPGLRNDDAGLRLPLHGANDAVIVAQRARDSARRPDSWSSRSAARRRIGCWRLGA